MVSASTVNSNPTPHLHQILKVLLPHRLPPHPLPQRPIQQRFLRFPTLTLLQRLEKHFGRAPVLLDLQRLVAGDETRAHEHFEKDVAEGEAVGFGGERGEGGVGDGVGCGRMGGAEVSEKGEVGSGVDVGAGDEVEGAGLWRGG